MKEFEILNTESFVKIRKGQYYYVDKTFFLEKFLRAPTDATLFTRPRRFGKTLFMSMLAEFFDITKNSHDIFEGLAVSANKELCEQWMNKYPVIFLSLKDVDKPTFAEALKVIRHRISEFCLKHLYLLTSPKLDGEEHKILRELRTQKEDDVTLAESLRILTRAMQYHYDKPAIVLIDEYDAPVTKAADNGYYDEMLDFLRNFLSAALKGNTDNLAFGILTGCMQITKHSLFSDLNNFREFGISATKYADIFGFTQQEVHALLSSAGLSSKESEIREWYDGYLFGKQQEIYCPWSIMNYLEDLQEDAESSPQAYWQNNTENALIKSLFPGTTADMTQDIASFIAGDCLAKELSSNPTFESLDSTPKNLWTLLYMSGYLTRASKERAEAEGFSPKPGENKCPLVIPNREIRDIFKDEVSTWFRKSVSETQQNEFFTAFWNVDAEGVKKELEAILLEKVSSQDLAKDSPKSPRENFYHGLLIGYFLVAYPQTFSNLQAGTGQYDIRVLDDTDTTNKKAAIVEIKRAAKEEEDLAKLAEDGLTQIRERKYDVRLLSDPSVKTLLHWSIAFFKKSCEARAVIVRQP